MNQNSRTRNSIVNIIVNFGYQFLIVLLTFITRRIFIENLGINFLGISGLFANVLGILALAELGIGGAMSFSMYKEIAENNQDALKALSSYFKTLYNRIALIILIVGIVLLPFLKYLIKLEENIPNLEIYYLISLVNTVISYLFVYKTTIAYADQNDYKLKVISCGMELLKSVLQILSLLVFKNYFLFLGIQVFFSFLSNYIKSKFTEKWYPFTKEKKELDEVKKKMVWDNIKPMFIYKFAGVALNSTDNILISIMINTTMVGIYSNYTMIFNKIYGFINLFFSSIIASVGNLNVTSNGNKIYSLYKIISFLSFWMYCIAVVGIYFIAEDVIMMISGTTRFLLDKSILIISLINFYMRGMLEITGIYRQTTDLFKMTKKAVIYCALINLLLSLIFGSYLGLFGILLATSLSRLCTSLWFEPYKLYKNLFKERPINYLKTQTTRVLICIGIIIIMTPLVNCICIDHLYIRIAIKFLFCCIIPNIFIILIYKKSYEFKYLFNKLKDIFKKIKQKV